MAETERKLPTLAFVAPSGTGKTTLLESVVSRLQDAGLCVAVLKASHHDHDLDVEGKDSWRFQRAGAGFVGLCGPQRTTFFVSQGRETWPSVSACAAWLAAAPFASFDVLLCEGFSSDGSVPKLRVVRGAWPESGSVAAGGFDDLIAIAWDGIAGSERPLGLPPRVRLLDLDAGEVAGWIQSDLLVRG